MIIGLSGYARSGKDTAAALLAPYGYQRVSFADVLRDAALAIDPIVAVPIASPPIRLSEVVSSKGWDDAKTRYPEIRRTLQRIGTELGRNLLGENVWVDAAFKDLDPTGNYVVSDMRFKNEAQAIEDRGGITVRIHRKGVVAVNDHPSEHDLDDWPFEYHVFNDDKPEDMIGTLVRFAGLAA